MFGCGDRAFICHPTTQHPNVPVPADPDIAGRGVLIAFGATSVITLLGIALAYLSDIIPAKEDIDHTVSDEVSHVGLVNKLDKEFLCRWGPFRRLTRPRTREETSKQFEAVQHFVLTLSDQQIVTGLAMFIIGYSRHCTIFTYHFFLIVAMGWFSSTTHLSTLTILNDYFKDAASLRFIRLLGMLTTFIMLFVGLLVLYTDLHFSVRVQCRFHRIFIPAGRPLNTICMALIFSYLIVIAVSKSLGFCFSRQGPFSSVRAIIFHLADRTSHRPSSSSRKKYYTQRLRRVLASQSSLMNRYVIAYFLIFSLVYSELLDSFFWEILWLFFQNIYGIRQLFWARVYVRNHVNIQDEGSENTWGFGQLLALLLLVLPVLAAAEAYRDATRKEDQTLIALVDEPQHSNNTRPVTERASSTSRLNVRRDSSEATQDGNAFHDERSSHSHAALGVSNAPWGLEEDDPYDSPLFWIIFVGLVLYTLATMIVSAWYLAWHIGPSTYPGIEASIAMAGLMLLAALGPLYQDYQASKN